MIEFASDIFRGIYPYFGIPAIAGIIYLIYQHKFKKIHAVTLSFFLLSIAAMAAQIIIADHTWDIPRRYLLPFAPLLSIFAAVICEPVKKLLPDTAWKTCVTVLLLLFIYDAYNPAIKEYTSARRRNINREIISMSKVLNEQLQDAEYSLPTDMWFYEPRFPARAVIKDAPPELIYLTGTRLYNPYIPREAAQYVISKTSEHCRKEKFKLLYQGKYFTLYEVSNRSMK